MRRARFLLALVLFLVTILPPKTGQAGFVSQTSSAHQQAQALLARLSPEEKVGQLFLVTFKGTDVSAGSQISDLVTKQHIGGVMLSAANDNFVSTDNTVPQTYELTANLQNQVMQAYQGQGTDGVPSNSNYVPLFVGISQEGDGYPNDQILNGMTPLPDLMAIGGTWKPDLSRQVGNVLGSELQAMGFNLLLGPSLDVLDTLPQEGTEDMGTRTFGGDPYWVGLMSQAYIQGIHEGSNNRMAVIAKHFPGRGGSDRPAEEEVATVQKSLEQLKQIELAPFFSVTGNAPSPASTTDGLLVSHIRYQGFQGNIRATTRPVSFDPAALELILALPPFASWRSTGGIMVSDDLGSPALRKFYDTTGQVFDARQVARNAFLAGNDLLYLNNFIADGDPDSYTTILRTLSLFTQKYREDRAFAERVDTSVERLLTLKYQIYPGFNPNSIVPPQSQLAQVGQSQQVTFEVARQAATLISPAPEELETVLPRPPGLNDRIVFITDARTWRQCAHCSDQTTLPVDGLQNAVNRLYGPQTGGQVVANHLSSYSLGDLQTLLNGTSNDVTPLEQDLRQASWIVFAILNTQQDHPETVALRRFLSERPDLFRNKRVIAFAFNAPYYLDATDISKLTAYYGIYSKVPAFVDVAARILFQELTPIGALPVSVPGIGYELITATSPEPDQVIPIYLDTPVLPPGNRTTTTPQPTPIPVFKVGDTLPLRTGTIYDHNHNLVPDGTVVRFLFTMGGDTGTVQQIETTTTNGIARTTYRIANPGLIEVRVASDPATTSQILRLDTAGGMITAIAPTLGPTETQTPTPTLTPTTQPTAVPTPPPPARPGTIDWMLSMAVIWGCAGAVYLTTRRMSVRWSFRWSMTAAAGGLLSYLYFAFLRLVNVETARSIQTETILLITFVGIMAGLAGGWLWRRWMENRARSQGEKHSTGPKSPTGTKPSAAP
jgi:beta-N-acetylhexosaminidase